MSQRQIADVLDVDRSTYTYYETNKTNPSISLLLKLAKLYGVTVDELLGNQSALRFNDVDTIIEFDDDEDGATPEEVMRFSELSDDEKMLILKYRLLEDKSEIMKFLDE